MSKLGRIALAAGFAAVVVAAAGGGADSRPLPPAYASPSWAPDGKTLVFGSASGPTGALLLAGAKGTSLRRLLRVGLLFQVAWSPRGDRIAYVANGRVFVVGRNGSGKVALGPGADIAWSPDGTSLAYDTNGFAGPIQVVRADGSGYRRVTDGAYDSAPAWSPDGRLVFSRTGTVDGAPELYTVRSDGTGLRSLGLQGDAPAWSSDGTRIAFWRQTDDGVALATADADGSGPVTLTRSFAAFSHAPQWSPDGRRIVFVLCSGLGFCRVDVASADGGVVTRIAGGSDAAWSPDGRRIAFATRRYCAARGFWPGIFVVGSGGGTPVRVTPCG